MTNKEEKFDFNSKWKHLKEGLEYLLKLNPKVDSGNWLDYYQDVYDICSATPVPYSEDLYKQLKVFLKGYLRTIKQNFRKGQGLLSDYSNSFQKYERSMTYCTDLLKYLNKWINKKLPKKKQQNGFSSFTSLYYSYNRFEFSQISTTISGSIISSILTIRDLFKYLWYKKIFVPFKKQLFEQILESIRTERDNGIVTQSETISTAINSFVLIGIDSESPLKVYKEFEKSFFISTKDYYTVYSVTELYEPETIDVKNYMKKIEKIVKSEERRFAKIYLHPSSYSNYIQICEMQTIGNHLQILLIEFQEILNSLHEDESNEQNMKMLAKFHSLIQRVPKGLKQMKKSFEKFLIKQSEKDLKAIEEYTRTQNKSNNNNNNNNNNKNKNKNKSDEIVGKITIDPIEYISQLTGLFKKFQKIIQKGLSDDSNMYTSLQNVLIEVFSENQKTSEMLAKFFDKNLKKTNRTLSELELNQTLNDSLALLEFVKDKDVFQKYYSTLMAKRLINDSSITLDEEVEMSHKLRGVCGFEFISKIERMFKDIIISTEITENFRYSDKKRKVVEINKNNNNNNSNNNNNNNNNNNRGIIKIPVNFKILSAGCWPVRSNEKKIEIFQPLLSLFSQFEDFYSQMHNGRILKCLHSISTVVLIVRFSRKRYSIISTDYQTMVLLNFNKKNEYTAKELKSLCPIDNQDFLFVLESLVKSKMLIAEPKYVSLNEITPENVFKLNRRFYSKKKLFRLRTPGVGRIEKEGGENRMIQRKIEEERKVFIQSAIIRILKHRKRIKHIKLINEIMNQAKSRFYPSTKIIAQCILILIDKEYIERVDGVMDEYSYIA
ncbi:cullin-2 [Anaeramoeba flamelloides]|uniref:Cullin-2 n=1 Tax=Anaeramoeba flamelloides TaxID=1746091 RepID=A0ABQ8ZCS1_9EUKA|nr:cullin-2 [Anaeramoeba flamelloides]